MNGRRTWLRDASILGVAGLGWALGLGGQASRAAGQSRSSSRGLPNVVLTTQHGRPVRFYDDLIRGKVVAINMMYTSCTGICPTGTANLREVQRLLGDRVGRQVHLYSITLAPELDTAEALREYAERHRVGPGWLFLTGRPENVEAVRISLGFYDPEPDVDRDKNSHSGMLRIGNDRLDRWSMAPVMGNPEQILGTLDHVDPDFSYSPQAQRRRGTDSAV